MPIATLHCFFWETPCWGCFSGTTTAALRDPSPRGICARCPEVIFVVESFCDWTTIICLAKDLANQIRYSSEVQKLMKGGGMQKNCRFLAPMAGEFISGLVAEVWKLHATWSLNTPSGNHGQDYRWGGLMQSRVQCPKKSLHPCSHTPCPRRLSNYPMWMIWLTMCCLLLASM